MSIKRISIATVIFFILGLPSAISSANQYNSTQDKIGTYLGTLIGAVVFAIIFELIQKSMTKNKDTESEKK